MPTAPRTQRSTGAEGPEPSASLSRAELLSALRGIEAAYEAAHSLADCGRIYFGPFEGLPHALRVLRDARDRLA